MDNECTIARYSKIVEVVEQIVWPCAKAPSLSGRRGKEGEAKLRGSPITDKVYKGVTQRRR